MAQVKFRAMADGTAEDYALLREYEQAYTAKLPDRILATLKELDGSLDGYLVTRLEHSLQTATRAEADGADKETIVAALLHDIGDGLAPYSHGAFAAAILKPYVRPEIVWVVEKHGVFQLAYYGHHVGVDRFARSKYSYHRWYGACLRFCERWDQASFDPDYQSKPLEHFEPLVREVFAAKAWESEP